MFADPLSLTIGGTPISLNRINQDKYSSEYYARTATQEWRVNIRNSSYTDKKRGVVVDRHNVELVTTVFPVAPSTLSTIRKTYTVIENQKGDNLTSPRDLAASLYAFLTNAQIDKLINFES